MRFRRGDDVDALTLFEAVLAPLIFTFPTPVVVATVAVAQIIIALRRTTLGESRLQRRPVVAGSRRGQPASSAPFAPTTTRPLQTLDRLVVARARCIGLVNNSAFTLVLAISGPQSVPSVLQDLRPVLLPGWLVGWAVNALIGLLFVLASDSNPFAVVLFPVPLVVLHLAYQGYATARADRSRLNGLREAAQTLSAPLHPRDAIDDFLLDVARCFEARGAALVLFDEAGDLEIHHTMATAGSPCRTEPRLACRWPPLLPTRGTGGFTVNDAHIVGRPAARERVARLHLRAPGR